MNRGMVLLAVTALVFAGCLDYTVDNFANDVQGALFGKKAARAPLPPTPEPTATPLPTATPVPTPLPTPAPHELPGVIGTNEIAIVYAAFSPRAVWVRAGTVVTWDNQDGRVHSVRSDADSKEQYDSGNIGGGQSWKRTFWSPGKFAYRDGLASAGSGVVYVE